MRPWLLAIAMLSSGCLYSGVTPRLGRVARPDEMVSGVRHTPFGFAPGIVDDQAGNSAKTGPSYFFMANLLGGARFSLSYGLGSGAELVLGIGLQEISVGLRGAVFDERQGDDASLAGFAELYFRPTWFADDGPFHGEGVGVRGGFDLSVRTNDTDSIVLTPQLSSGPVVHSIDMLEGEVLAARRELRFDLGLGYAAASPDGPAAFVVAVVPYAVLDHEPAFAGDHVGIDGAAVDAQGKPIAAPHRSHVAVDETFGVHVVIGADG